MNQLRKYVGNPSVKAVQRDHGTGYTPLTEPITDDDLRAHQLGQLTLGTYALRYDKARFIVFDVDEKDRPLANKLALACKRRGLDAAVEFSGRKGYHTWVLFDAWHQASDLRRLAKDIAAEVGFTGEIFPKQDVARNLGNLIKLPFGVHRATGHRSYFIGLEPRENAPAALSQALAEVPPPAAPSSAAARGALPCLDSIQSDPPREGQRNLLAFHFACHLRRAGLHHEAVAAAVAQVVDPDDLDPGEFDAIVENSEFSGPVCDQIPADRHCGEQCIKERSKSVLSQRSGQLRNAVEGEPVVMLAGPASDGVRTLTHPDAEKVLVRVRSMEEE